MRLKSKTCPECAEKVKPDAQVCRFCGHHFPKEEAATDAESARASRLPLILVSVIALLAIAGAVALGAYASSERNKASDAREEVASQSSQIGDLQSALADAQSEVRSAKVDARNQYDQGYKEGQQDQKLLGGIYDKGYKDRYADAFSGFGGWDQGSWYVVKIGVPDKASLQYNIDSRYDLEQCQLMYMNGDDLFSRGNGC